jgi:tetratricopeptide (TPR) repeat protein
MPTVREYEAALERNPADTEAFVALRKAYRQAQQHDKLITLYETRAQGIGDGGKAAELFYLAAELRLDQLGDARGAEADLANAVHRDPGHFRAAARLKNLYREEGRTGEYMEMLEMEAAAVARTRDAARVAELQAEMGQLFVNHFARLERTVRNAQRPGKISAENVKSIESARKIYRALGDYRAVVRLYELELEATTDPKRRAELLFGLGRVLAEKLEELDAAEQRLTEVVRLRPRDEKALDLLASVYANPNWIGADGAERAGAIYFQVARRRHEAGDIENAITAARKALSAAPGHAEASDLVEHIYYEAERFTDLDRYYRERIQSAPGQEEQIHFLYKRAQLAEGALDDKAEAQRIYSEIAVHEPPGGPAGEHLAQLYIAGQDYPRLAELREKQLGAVEDVGERVRLMTELAELYHDRLGDRDQAAVYLHAILQHEPANPAALNAYAEHFREKEDWGALIDLLEFGLEQSRAQGTEVAELVRRLEEIALLSDKNLADPERALSAWRRIEDLDPTYARAREAQKRILLKSKSFDRIVPVLEREVEQAADPVQKVEILRRIARIHREKLGAPSRAVDIYKEVLRLAPQDQVALRALVEIYEREGDWKGLAQTLREQLDADHSKQERVSLLRRLLLIYDERLADVTEGSWAAREILQLVPGDRDTLARLEALLERAGDAAGLVETLGYHTQHAATPDERIRLLARMAELLEQRLDDPAGAAGRWEEVVRLDPDDGRALDALTAIYERLGQHLELARILDAQIERLVGDPQQQAEHLRHLAELCEGPLGDQHRARLAWEALLDILPADTVALEALARIHTANEDWGTLVRILDRQIPYAGDPARAVELALRRATILDEKLGTPEDAARGLEVLIAELDPRNWEAHERLRALYERLDQWAKVVGVAERQLFLTEDPADRGRRALELGTMLRDRLHDGPRAIAAFERALEIDPRSLAALEALAPLYGEARNWERLVAVNEKLLAAAEDADRRHILILEIAALLEQHLEDPRGAFEWYRRAHNERQDLDSLNLLDSVAEKHGLYDELIQVYDGARARAADPDEQLAASLKIASICETKLDAPARGFAVLRETLPADPSGRELLPHLERLAARVDDWQGLLDVYARVARGRPDLRDRVELLQLRAEVKELRVGDPSGALDELVRSFALDPKNPATQKEILRLAGITGRWEDALRVQGQLFALAEELPDKIAIARNAAALVEHEVKDLVRAFRAYLNAFRLAPEDPEIVAHLWRLATRIGRYEAPPVVSARGEKALAAMDDDHRQVVTPPPGIPIPSAAAAKAAAAEGAAVPGVGAGEFAGDEDEDEAVTPPPAVARIAGAAAPAADAAAGEDADATLTTEASELRATQAGASAEDADETRHTPPPLGDADATLTGDALAAGGGGDMEVEVDDASVIAEAIDPDSSGVLEELEVDDIEVTVDEDVGVTPPPVPVARVGGPPPPTPPALGFRAPPFAAAFETPWEELAAAYESLSAPDPNTRRRYLLKIAEVWELGAKDVDRAIEALQRAFKLDPDHPIARAELERVATDHDRWDEVCDIYLEAIDEFAPAERTVALHHEVARFREELGQTDRAEERYHAILALRPEDKKALGRLEEITREQERWPELATILDREISGPLDPLPPGPERRSKLRELAELFEIRLEKPYEAIDGLERLVSEASESSDDITIADSGGRSEIADALESLARMYGRVGMWAKMVEALSREAELVTDTAAIRTLRLQIAHVLEQELKQSERAIEAYDAVAAVDPNDDEALAALDRLYEAQSRWSDLQEVLARRASRAENPELRRELVRRRARLLEERLGNAEAAASALRDLGSEVIESDLGDALVRNLRRAGMAHEASRVLGQRVEAARAAGEAGSAQVVPLLLQLAAVRSDDLEDPDAAREAIASALEAAPDRADVLGALARLELKSNNFTAYAATRRREARALADPAAAVSSFLEAGRVYREQAGAPDEARAAFEEALARDPDHVEVLRSLASLHAAQGDWAVARVHLDKQLKLTEEPEARAAVLTDLARAIWEGSGDTAEAQRHLDEALELAPSHLPAVLAAADMFYKEGQWAVAEKRLTDAVRRIRGKPEQTARLYVRLAEVSEKLGKLDEAYRQLTEADRLAPAQLSTKLAMGDNRYRAGKWREAAVHLAPLADHPEALRHAEDVADGLARGAQAEIKLRRPERAMALYESALALYPAHAPALRAVADLALERGDKDAARGYLERLVEATTEKEARLALLEQLGDLHADAGDPTAARKAYQSAVALFERPTEALVSVLEKALALQRQADDVEEAARTSSLLIELVQDPKERANRRREAATLIAARGEGNEALELLEAAYADNPQDDAVLANLCDLLVRQGKSKQVGKRLTDALPALAPPADTPAARKLRASLWERLGDARKKKDPTVAITAYEQALEFDGDLMSVRTSLAPLYETRVEFADAALANLRRLVDADPLREGNIMALAEAFAGRGMLDPARCAYELVDLFSGASNGNGISTVREFLKAHPSPERKPEDPYSAALDDDDRRALVGAEAGVMAEVFTLLWEAAPHLLNERLEDLGLTADDKVSPMSDLDAAKVYGQVAKALGNKKTSLYIKRGTELPEPEIVVQTPPALVFGVEILAAPLGDARFEIARGLELTRPEHILAAGVRPKQFTQLFGTVLRAFHPRHAKRRSGSQDTAADEQATNLRKNVPYKVSKRLAELFQEMGGTAWSSVRWRKVVGDTGNRAGLLLSGDVRAAVRGVLRAGKLSESLAGEELAQIAAGHEPLRELVRFALSDNCFRLREKLGTAAVGAAAA